MLVTARRASAILYNLLKSIKDDRAFLLPASICPIVPLTFLKAGRAFEFVDISPDTLVMNSSETLRRLRRHRGRYAGVLFVRAYGAMFPMEELFRAIKEIDPSLLIVDDRCLTPPEFDAADEDTDVVLYSTGVSKYADIAVGGLGRIRDGIPYSVHATDFREEDLLQLTASYKRAVAERVQFNYVDSAWLDNRPLGMSNSKYERVAADNVRDIREWKKAINAVYAENLPGDIQLPSAYQNWRFNVFVPESDWMMKSIFSQGHFASSHFASLQGIFSQGPAAMHAENVGGRIVNLFNDRHYSPEKAFALTRIIREHVKEACCVNK